MSALPCSLYVHLPWCARKCPYCDFNSHLAPAALPEAEYVDALLADLELELAHAAVPAFASVFIGGGTPSLFSGAAIARLLAGIAARATLTAGVEITLEANPGSAEAARFAAYRAAGVNRLSLGIQSFDDDCLRALGRVHDARQARAAVDAARRAGFDNLNLDLMFGLPAARPGTALRDLDQAIALAPAHLSWYQLTLEEGTPFARRPPALPSHDASAAEQDAGIARLAAAGYRRYEISAYARAGREARHNLNYWTFGDYVGIGAGAHGKRTDAAGNIRRRVKPRQPRRYAQAACAGGDFAEETLVAPDERVLEYMLNALRLADGFTVTTCASRIGLAPDDPRLARPLATAVARGWLARDDDHVRPTALGYRFLDDLLLLFVQPADIPNPAAA